jgi:hypothetical protein
VIRVLPPRGLWGVGDLVFVTYRTHQGRIRFNHLDSSLKYRDDMKMKKRFENLLAMSLSLLMSAVWIPTFWVLLQLPWTWDGEKSSAFLDYVDQGLGTVEYQITSISDKGTSCIPGANPWERTDGWLTCETTLSTEVGDSFIGLALLTLLILGVQYLITGRISLRFKKQGA